MQAGKVGKGCFSGLKSVEDVDVRVGSVFTTTDGSEDADLVDAVGFAEGRKLLLQRGEDCGSDGGVGFGHADSSGGCMYEVFVLGGH